MPSVRPLGLTSELSAVNRMLSAIGEAPIQDLTNSTREDVALAVSLLKTASVEVQSRGWKFNKEFGYELAPNGTLLWVPSDGSTAETLNVFAPPSNLISFELTKSDAQIGLDVALRPPRKYTGAEVIIYDRAKNRDGFEQSVYPSLYLDAIWFFEFDLLPQTARSYITMKAARQFIQQSVGAPDLVGYSQQDEAEAFLRMESDQGDEGEANIFDSADVARVRGCRPPLASGFLDYRASPRPL